MTPVARMGRLLQWTLLQYGVLGIRPSGLELLHKNLFGRREAISYAVIIYSSLGMEEEAFTGVINIFVTQEFEGKLGACDLTLPCLIL